MPPISSPFSFMLFTLYICLALAASTTPSTPTPDFNQINLEFKLDQFTAQFPITSINPAYRAINISAFQNIRTNYTTKNLCTLQARKVFLKEMANLKHHQKTSRDMNKSQSFWEESQANIVNLEQFWSDNLIDCEKYSKSNKIICIFENNLIVQYQSITQQNKTTLKSLILNEAKSVIFGLQNLSYGNLISTDVNLSNKNEMSGGKSVKYEDCLVFMSERLIFLISNDQTLVEIKFEVGKNMPAGQSLLNIERAIVIHGNKVIMAMGAAGISEYELGINTDQVSTNKGEGTLSYRYLQSYRLYSLSPAINSNASHLERVYCEEVINALYNEETQTMYVMDEEEGVKYYQYKTLQEQVRDGGSEILVTDLLPIEYCTDMQIKFGYLFVTCSSLVIIDLQTNTVRYRYQSDFSIQNVHLQPAQSTSDILSNEIVLFGIKRFSVHTLTYSNKLDKLYLIKTGEGIIPSFSTEESIRQYIFADYHTHTTLSDIFLISDRDITYNSIQKGKYALTCQDHEYIMLLRKQQERSLLNSQIDASNIYVANANDLLGSNLAILKVEGPCEIPSPKDMSANDPKKNRRSGISDYCQIDIHVLVDVTHIKTTKTTLQIFAIDAIILSILGAIAYLYWQRKKLFQRKDSYKNLVEETLNDDFNADKQKDTKTNSNRLELTEGSQNLMNLKEIQEKKDFEQQKDVEKQQNQEKTETKEKRQQSYK